MKKRLFTLATVVSMVLCVASAVVWARSYNVSYSFGRDFFDASTHTEGGQRVSLASGRIYFSWDRFFVPPNAPERLPSREGWQLYRDPYWFAIRQKYGDDWLLWTVTKDATPAPKSFGRSEGWTVGFNLLMLVFLTAIAPTMWRVRFLRTKRRPRSGLCPSCGYDLRATPERCPECGNA